MEEIRIVPVSAVAAAHSGSTPIQWVASLICWQKLP